LLALVFDLTRNWCRYNPTCVDDAAAAVQAVVVAARHVYELGGPDVHSFRELMQLMLGIICRRRLIVNTPSSG
jgi:NADH dehydrogenase